MALLLTVLLGFTRGALVIFQAHFLSLIIAGMFLGGIGPASISNGLIILLVIYVIRAGLAWGSEVSAHQAAAGIKTDLRSRLFSSLIRNGPSYSQGERTGELVNTAVNGIESLETYFSQYLPQLVLAILVPLTIVLLVLPLDPLTGVILVVTAPLIPLFIVLITNQTNTVTRRQWTSLSRLSAYFLDTLQGLVTLKLLGRSQAQGERIASNSEQYRQATMKVLRVTFLSALVLELVGTISMAVVAVEIGLRLLYTGLGYQQAFFILILAPEFYLPLRNFGARFHAAMPGITAAHRIDEILQTKPASSASSISEIGQTQQETTLRTPTDPPQHMGGEIHFEKVDFSYPEGQGEFRPALHSVSFNIHPEQRIALVGPSGAGKSTILALLLRFIEPTGGRIILGGEPLSSISPSEWRKQVAWVPQQPYIFNDTLEANLRLGDREASQEKLMAAVRLAHLEQVIQSLPNGIQSLVGEKGAVLSSGQLQRLALARAFLKDTPLLLLDEPTASLDPQQEVLFQATVEQLGHGKTILTIAHRLATARQADQILVLAGGRLVESGTHTELLDLQGTYYQMVKVYDNE